MLREFACEGEKLKGGLLNITENLRRKSPINRVIPHLQNYFILNY